MVGYRGIFGNILLYFFHFFRFYSIQILFEFNKLSNKHLINKLIIESLKNLIIKIYIYLVNKINSFQNADLLKKILESFLKNPILKLQKRFLKFYIGLKSIIQNLCYNNNN